VGGYYAGADPETGEELMIGTVAHVTLTKAVSHGDITLPIDNRRPYYYEWPDDLQARYSPFFDATVSYHIEKVTDFDVQVDLARRRVVNFIFSFPSNSDSKAIEATPTDFDPVADLQQKSAKVSSIAENDPAVAAALSDGKLTIRFAYEYQAGEHHFGLYVAYKDGTAKLRGDWLEIVDSDRSTGDYRSETIHVVTEIANELDVTVDLDARKVIGIEARFLD
jgi:hypothetical protein